MTSSLILRPARAADASTLLALARELAVYEREPEAVSATTADYQRWGFGPEALFAATLAEWQGEPVGFSLHFFTFSTWTGKPTLYLEDLFVRPDFRGKGIGKALFANLARLALERGCARFEWQVLDWNAPAIAFYEAQGARCKSAWLPFRLEGEALARLAAAAPEPNRSR